MSCNKMRYERNYNYLSNHIVTENPFDMQRCVMAMKSLDTISK